MSTWTVSGYTGIRELGQRPTGRTMLATHAATGLAVVIRYVSGPAFADVSSRERYRATMRLLMRLADPYTMSVYEYAEGDDSAATIREYVRGASYRALARPGEARPGEALPAEAAMCVAMDCLRGLSAAYAIGLVHGAVTPDNVLVDETGRTKLSDHGGPRVDVDVVAADAAIEEVAIAEIAGAGVAADVAAVVDMASAALPLDGRAGKRARGLHELLAAAGRTLAQPVTDVSAVATAVAEIATGIGVATREAYGDRWETKGRTQLSTLVARIGTHDRKPGT